MNNSEISRIVDPTFIKDLIKHYFLENGYDMDYVNEYLNHIEITIRNKPVYSRYISQEKVERDASKLHKSGALVLCNQNNLYARDYNTTYACVDGRGYFPANAAPRHIHETWYLLLDDCYKRKLHVLRIPANSFKATDFHYRQDNGSIVLSINQNLIDLHPEDDIANYLEKFRVTTIDY